MSLLRGPPLPCQRSLAAHSHSWLTVAYTNLLDGWLCVHRRGDDLLKRICNPEGAKPGVDLEQPALVAKLYALLLGDCVSASSSCQHGLHRMELSARMA